MNINAARFNFQSDLIKFQLKFMYRLRKQIGAECEVLERSGLFASLFSV